MKPPRHVQIGPHRYRVVMVRDGVLEGAGAAGLCQPERLTIAVDDGAPSTLKGDTLCHEIGHALLAAVKLDDDVEESICRVLGPGVLALIRDNPRLVEWIRSL